MPSSAAGAMSAISLVDFASSFSAKVNSLDMDDIHPSGAVIVREYLCEMRHAAEEGRADEVAKFARWADKKIADERAWQAEKLRCICAMRARP